MTDSPFADLLVKADDAIYSCERCDIVISPIRGKCKLTVFLLIPAFSFNLIQLRNSENGVFNIT